ncbi:hypothetical protein DSO57_1015439 [Entomophthora muscae]|uniref:Uncharacterized protein n=2 Tax=Entomophthora muscae TaxID=34485 RepID=A0ACC2U3H7_9FUNG|nr:hypothetical protein DSO57_1015439 [Entomophthora muscae]
MDVTNKAPEVYVRYQCSCTTPTGIHGLQLPAHFPTRMLASSDMVDCLCQPLDEFYLCDTCNLLKCQRCIKEDVLFHYCPNCHFEVQGAISQADKMKCWRNCLLCPECQSNLTVMEELTISTGGDKEVSVDVIAEPAVSGEAGSKSRKFHYFCYACKYDSREMGLIFDKTMFLANAVAEIEKNKSPLWKELSVLQLHYDIEHMVPHFFSFNPALYAIEGVEGFDIRVADLFRLRGRPYQSQLSKEMEEDPTLEEKIHQEEKDHLHYLTTLPDVSYAPSIHKLVASGQCGANDKLDRFPQRQPLRSRRVKSCLTCQTVLSRPNPKVNHSHRFAFKYPGINYVPAVALFEVPKLVADKPLTVGLRFTNPLYYKVFIKLSSPLAPDWFVPYESNRPEDVPPADGKLAPGSLDRDPSARFPPEFNHLLDLPTPKFSVEAYREGWEMDEGREMDELYDGDDDFDIEGDEEELAALASLSSRPSLLNTQEALQFDPKNPYKAIVDRHANTTAILVAVTPRGESGTEVVVPLLLTYTTRLLPRDKEGADDDAASIAGNRPTSPANDTSANPSTLPDQSAGCITTTDSGREYHTRHTWIYVKLGNIA